MGLHNDASKRCFDAMSLSSNSQIQRLASYINGQALLAVARQNLGEGKYGACLAHIKKGARLVLAESYSELKLLGDLYSLCEALPSYVFLERNDDTESKDYGISVEVHQKLALLAQGARSYSKALELAKRTDTEEEETSYLTSVAATDLGCNLLARARVVALALGDGSGDSTPASMADIKVQYAQLQSIINESINAFICAIDSSPDEAAAWCGIGCALVSIDPLKTQHAFSRALELDRGSAEAWSNMALMFSHYNSRDKGSEILDALSQAGDTPLMWICRGLLFESASDVWIGNVSSREVNLAKAADAYRAALQICNHPSAILGLALTCRRNDLRALSAGDAIYSTNVEDAAMNECRLNMSIHQCIAGEGNHISSCVNSFLQLEKSINQISSRKAKTVQDVLASVHVFLKQLKDRTVKIASVNKSECSSDVVQCELSCASMPTLKSVKQSGNVPSDIIDKAIAKVSVVVKENLSASSEQMHQSLGDLKNVVYCNPDSGEKWLTLAKALTKEVCLDESRRTQKLASAKAAALRALSILHENVVHSSMISPAARVVADGVFLDRSEIRVASCVASAEIVSEALSMVAWLDDLEKIHANEKQCNILVPSFYMQDAYLLDPQNSIAAHQIEVK